MDVRLDHEAAPATDFRSPAARVAGAALEAATVEAIERLLVGGIGITALAVAEEVDAVDLTLAQWRALVIAAEEDGVRVGELANRLGVKVPSASRLVRRLERRGLVTAVRDEDDRRATIVRPSPTGRRIRNSVISRRRRLIATAAASALPGVDTETVATIDRIADALARYA
jgi:DNA-binding MarR family transcriptional regulator